MQPTGFVPILKTKSIHDINMDLKVGFLVYFDHEGELLFQDAGGKLHDLAGVSFLTTEWNTEDGNKNLPKPYISSTNGQITGLGDNLLYGYTDNGFNNIVIFGSLANISLKRFDDSLNTDPMDLASIIQKSLVRNNEQRHFTVKDDAQGGVIVYLEGKTPTDAGLPTGTGNLLVKIKGTEGNGVVRLETNGQLAITQIQGTDTEVITAQILLDNTEGAESISVKDKFNNVITLDQNGITITSDQSGEITVTGDLKISVGGNAEVTTQGDSKISTNGNAEVTAQGDLKISVGGDAEVTAQGNTTITSKITEFKGTELVVSGTATPNLQGAFCAIPQCIFSGAWHTSDKVELTDASNQQPDNGS